jgi:hypothetical protein
VGKYIKLAASLDSLKGNQQILVTFLKLLKGKFGKIRISDSI